MASKRANGGYRVLGQANCAWCNEMFDVLPKRTTYCGRTCAVRARAEGRSTPIPWAQCPTCDGWLIARGQRVYCSEACRPAVSHYEPRVYADTCGYCGIIRIHRRQGRPPAVWYCDAWCKSEADAALLEIRGCQVCGVSFMAYSQQLYCSADCRPYDHVTIPADIRQYVYRRDGYRCHLCGDATRTDVDPQDKLAPTLDHIIPKAHGGTHDVANLRCAHRKCNSSKGTRAVGEQLLLVG